MTRCATCGTENIEGAHFCANCGATLPVEQPVSAETPVNTPEPVGAGVGATSDTPPTPVGASVGTSQSASRGSGVSTNDMFAGLQHATDRFEAATRPYDAQLKPIQDALAPLESLGKQMLGWIGSALIFVGLFLPIKTWSVSILGYSGATSDNYFGLNGIEAIFFLILALAAAGLSYLRMYVWLYAIGIVLLLFFIFGFINSFMSDFSGVSAHPSWGWILLFPGALALLAAAAMRDTKTR